MQTCLFGGSESSLIFLEETLFFFLHGNFFVVEQTGMLTKAQIAPFINFEKYGNYGIKN